MTELQKTQLKILECVIDICKQLKLKYYLVCGSALGAVKYEGFIPWDDDIDLALPREDYEVFCQNAANYLPDYYFLQNHHTDKYFPALYSKVRDSRTTYIEKGVAHLPMNHGIYIDVFPLDGYPRTNRQCKKLEIEKCILKLVIACSVQINPNQSMKVRLLLKIGQLLGLHRCSNKAIKLLESKLIEWRTNDTDYLCNHGNWQGKLEYAPKWHYGKGVFCKFEGLTVRVPENYDAYLTQKYGDWRMDLPEEEQIGHHYYEICDLKKPYTEYMIY